MRLTSLITQYYSDLNQNDLYVLNFIIDNMEASKNKTVTELASACNISASSIIRMTKKLGFDGYSEFKYYLQGEYNALKKEQNEQQENFDKSILLEDVAETVKLFKQNNQLPEIYHYILSAKRIIAYGTGHSQNLMLQEFARCLLNNNLFMTIIPSKTELALVSKNLSEDDILIVASLSGEVADIQDTLQVIKLKKTTIISITLFKNNPLAQLAPYNLFYQVTSLNTVDKLNNSSFLALNLVMALLYEGITNNILQEGTVQPTIEKEKK